MDLKAAIKLATRFADKKTDSIQRYVRFLPKVGDDQPARLCAQNARCGVIVFLDSDVPNTLLLAEFLEKVVKESKFEIQVNLAAYGGMELTSGPAKWWVRAEEIPQLEWFPQVPPVPENFQAIDDGAISRVVHAASKDEDRLNLQTLHFRKGYVEATDKARFARAPISGQWEGLLPVEIFQKLVKGDTKAAFALRLAYLRCEDEVRFAPYVGLPFPNCEELIPAKHEGFEAVVSVESLTRAAKQALAVSETGSVNLRFEGTRLTISTWRKDKDPKLFEAVVGISWSSGDGQVLVNGKNLVAALKIVVTPSVRIGYHQPTDPLKVDTAGFTEVLWPMLA